MCRVFQIRLSTYFTSLDSIADAGPMIDTKIDIHCVFGESHCSHINNVLIPSLQRATDRKVRFNVINYEGKPSLNIFSKNNFAVEVNNYTEAYQHHIGFAEAHNILASKVENPCFIIINPDCIFHDFSVDRIIDTYTKQKETVGIIEGRQWPFEHPKEYNESTLKTPWASAAFCLFNTKLYKKINGMDERFFLYLEDVDISWRMWIEGAVVLYEPSAVVTHFTGRHFYRHDIVENEKYYSARNFILLLKKFFGDTGTKKALNMLKSYPDQEIVSAAVMDIEQNFQKFKPLESIDIKKYKQIKVTGINLFHKVRP